MKNAIIDDYKNNINIFNKKSNLQVIKRLCNKYNKSYCSIQKLLSRNNCNYYKLKKEYVFNQFKYTQNISYIQAIMNLKQRQVYYYLKEYKAINCKN